jgi:hypothetical protein
VISQAAQAMREQQAQVISQAAQAMIPDLRDLVARSQPDLTSVAQTLAAINTASQLDRLMTVLNESLRTHLTAAQVAARVEEEVPEAAPAIAPLLKDGGVALAAWLALFVAVLTFLLQLQVSQQQPAPAITPEQVEEIITRVVDEVEERDRRSGR